MTNPDRGADLTVEIAHAELAAWETYWDRESNTQEHALYVPGKILEWRATLEAIDQGVDFGDPTGYRHLEVTRYWSDSGRCRRALEVDMAGARFADEVAPLTVDDYRAQRLVCIRWRPVHCAESITWPVPKLGALDQVTAGGPVVRLWMPWVPLQRGAPLARPMQLDLFAGATA